MSRGIFLTHTVENTSIVQQRVPWSPCYRATELLPIRQQRRL